MVASMVRLLGRSRVNAAPPPAAEVTDEALMQYLFGVAFNVLMDWRRRTRTFETLDAESAAAVPDVDAGIWVRTALARLEPEDREILMLREYEQLSYQELSEVLTLPVNTVKSRLFRARAAMRVVLTELPAEVPLDAR